MAVTPAPKRPLLLPPKENDIEIAPAGKKLRLTNLQKPFWPKLGITKRDLLQYYADVSRYLLPHLKNRAMVMKRYPNGAEGDFFFMKRGRNRVRSGCARAALNMLQLDAGRPQGGD
jgi:bifunctional non-homologous end joining protein LigD